MMRRSSTRRAILLTLLVSALWLTSCAQAPTPTPLALPAATATPVPLVPSPTIALPVPTLTIAPPAPTATVAPSVQPQQPVRIQFATGATSAAVQGNLAAGGIDEYLLRALAGQRMMVLITSPENSVVVEIYGLSDGQPLVRSDMGQIAWQGVLPATQDYDIKAVSTGAATAYTLEVFIPVVATPLLPTFTAVAATPTLPSQVRRIEFAPGATSAVVQGILAAEAIDEYLLRALAGQWMTVLVTSPDSSVVLEIYGVTDGQPLLRSHMRQTYWQGVLPATQDYGIKAVSTAGATSYTLEVIIPAIATPPPQVRRIEFAAGATSAVVQGSLAAQAIDEYLLRALAGQWLMAMVSSPDDSVVLEIYGVSDGQPLVRSHMRQTFWQGTLPATQDYGVKAVSTAGAVDYTLQVIIPERVQFAAGAISATRSGSLAPRETHEYLLRALAGQTMTVNIDSPGDLVLLEIYGIDDGQPLVRVPMGVTTWTGVLPNTQDYDIKAVSVTDWPTTYQIEFIVP